MTVYVLKPDRHVDLYVGWDVTTGGPVQLGTRAELLADGVLGTYLDFADERGSNAIAGRFGTWAWPGFHAEADLPEPRWLPREHLAAYAVAVFEERGEDALELTALEDVTL